MQVPFWGPTEAAIFKQVQRGQLDLTRAACKRLTRESKELMLSMLNRDPAVCHSQQSDVLYRLHCSRDRNLCIFVDFLHNLVSAAVTWLCAQNMTAFSGV